MVEFLFFCYFCNRDILMGMLVTTALLLPCIVSLIWGTILLALKQKSSRQKLLCILCITTAIYFFADANYLMDDPDYFVLVWIDIIAQFITLCLIPITYAYLRNVRQKPVGSGFYYATFIPAIALGTASLTIYAMIGIPEAAEFMKNLDAAGGIIPDKYEEMQLFRAQRLVCNYLYNALLLTEVVIMLVGIVLQLIKRGSNFQNFILFFKGKTAAHPYDSQAVLVIALLAICAIRIGLGRLYLVEHQAVSSILSLLVAIVIAAMGYIGTWFGDGKFSLKDISTSSALRSVMAASEIEKEDELAKARDSFAVSRENVEQKDIEEFNQTGNKTLLQQFISYMNNEKPYLNPSLTITDVATALLTNRTYISILVNKNFNLTFRDYINNMRLNYAKMIIESEPDTILEDIAIRSGFTSDSQLVRKFKEVEGMSPRAWEAMQKKEKA